MTHVNKVSSPFNEARIRIPGAGAATLHLLPRSSGENIQMACQNGGVAPHAFYNRWLLISLCAHME